MLYDYLPKPPKTPQTPPPPKLSDQDKLMQNLLNICRNFIMVVALAYLIFISNQTQYTFLFYTFAISTVPVIIHSIYLINQQQKINAWVHENHPELEKLYIWPTPTIFKKFRDEFISIAMVTFIISVIISPISFI